MVQASRADSEKSLSLEEVEKHHIIRVLRTATDLDAAEAYRKALNLLPGSFFKQTTQFFGHPVLTLVTVKPVVTRQFLSRLRAWQAIRNTAFGQWLKYSVVSRWLR